MPGTSFRSGARTASRPGPLLTWPAFAARVRHTAEHAGATHPGGALIIAVDGFSGAGKSWLATRLARDLNALLVHVDDFIPGWDALQSGVDALEHDLIQPWSHGDTGTPLPYDWNTAATGPRLALPAPAIAVLEGSGIASLPSESGLCARVWVHASATTRRHRLDSRADHDAYLPYRTTWTHQERQIARTHHTPHHCDLRVLHATLAAVQLSTRF